MREIIFWSMGMLLVGLPIGLSLFTIFLMLTAPATEEEILDYGHWMDQDDIDNLTKKS